MIGSDTNEIDNETWKRFQEHCKEITAKKVFLDRSMCCVLFFFTCKGSAAWFLEMPAEALFKSMERFVIQDWGTPTYHILQPEECFPIAFVLEFHSKSPAILALQGQ